jgi:hypothetical protein
MRISNIIDLIIDRAKKIGQNFGSQRLHRDFENLVIEVDDGEAARVYRSDIAAAKATIARAVHRNMANIKARLWRPDGRLMTATIRDAFMER